MIKHSEVKVLKSVIQSTGEKRYIPHIFYKGREKALRLSWNTHTRAQVYGNAVFERYIQLLIARTVIVNK